LAKGERCLAKADLRFTKLQIGENLKICASATGTVGILVARCFSIGFGEMNYPPTRAEGTPYNRIPSARVGIYRTINPMLKQRATKIETLRVIRNDQNLPNTILECVFLYLIYKSRIDLSQ